MLAQGCHRLQGQSALLVKGRIASSTEELYDKVWNKWCLFSASIGVCGTDLTTLGPLSWTPDYSVAVDAVLMFMAFLAYDQHLQPSTILTYLPALKHKWSMAGINCVFLESYPIESAKKGITKVTIEGTHVTAGKRLPFTKDLILYCRDSLLQMAKVDHLAIFTAMVVMYVLGLRVSEVLYSKDNPHYLLGRDIQFSTRTQSVVDAHRVGGTPYDHVTGVFFRLKSAKNNQTKKQIKRVYDKRVVVSPRELCVVKCMYDWCAKTCPVGDSPCFTLGQDGWLSSAKVEGMMKLAARANGVDQSRITVHSLRYSNVSTLAAGEMEPETIGELGNWNSNAYLEYLRLSSHTTNRAHDILCGKDVLTSKDVKRSM